MTDDPTLTGASASRATPLQTEPWAVMGRTLDQFETQGESNATFDFGSNGALAGPDGQADAFESFEALADSSALPIGMFPFLRQAGERVARHIAQVIRQRSGALVEVAMIDHVNMRYGTALAAIPIPSLMGVLRVERAETEILIVVDGPMAALYFDLLLGGSQIRPTHFQPVRNFSVIETRLFETLADVMAESMAVAFRDWVSFDIKTDRIETNPRYLSFAKAQDSIVKMRLHVELGLRSGFVDCYIPARFLLPIEQKLRPKAARDQDRDDPAFKLHLKREVLKSRVDLVATLSEVQLSLNALRKLKAGDVIPLDKTSESLIDLSVATKLVARGKMGRSTGKIAVRIEDLILQNKHPDMMS